MSRVVATRWHALLLGVGATTCFEASQVRAYSGMAPPRSGDSASSSAAIVRVASYNVLSDRLSGADHFSHCDPGDLDPETRLARVQAKLEEQMDAGAVVCLQEVSRQWGARLLPLLERHSYAYAAAASGSPFNGYMGQLLAWPRDKYELVDADVTRVSDTAQGDWPKWQKPKKSLWQKIKALLNIGKPEKPPFDPWKEAERRHNVAVMARLKSRETAQSFVVGTYHMPCLFGSDAKCQVMVAHSSLLMQHAQRYAAGDPLVVCGDFNIKPDEPSYKLITEGTLSRDNPHFPPKAPFNPEWSPDITPMRSAYKLRCGVEPEFTNKALTKWSSEAFEECLDYIFISEGLRVRSVKQLPTSHKMKDVISLPSPDEPSDHILIAADIEIPQSK